MRGQIARSTDRSDYASNQFNLSEFNYFTEKGPNSGNTWDYNVQADYTHPLSSNGRNMLETGVSFTRSNSSTSSLVFNNQASPGSADLAEIPSRANDMDYFRNIYAAYASLKFETESKWTSGLAY